MHLFVTSHLSYLTLISFYISTALNSSKWLCDENKNWYFQKISDSDWIEIQNNTLLAKYTETSNEFDNNKKPKVVLKRRDRFVKLVEGETYWGETYNNINEFLINGHWQLEITNRSKKMVKFEKIYFSIILHTLKK